MYIEILKSSGSGESDHLVILPHCSHISWNDCGVDMIVRLCRNHTLILINAQLTPPAIIENDKNSLSVQGHLYNHSQCGDHLTPTD